MLIFNAGVSFHVSMKEIASVPSSYNGSLILMEVADRATTTLRTSQ